MPIMTATEARKNLYRLIDDVNESHDPVHISGKRCTAILVSERDWYCVQEAIQILSHKKLRESLLEGVNMPLEECIHEELDDDSEYPVALFSTKQAKRDAEELIHAGLGKQIEQLLSVLRDDPYQMTPPFGKLVGDLKQVCCRRISIQHRLLYEVLDDGKRVKILRMCSLYDEE